MGHTAGHRGDQVVLKVQRVINSACIGTLSVTPSAAAVVMTNCEKSEDKLSENVEGVNEAKIVKARDTLDVDLYCWRSPCRLKTR